MRQLHFCYWTKKPKSLFKESPISAQNLSHAKFLKLRNTLLFTIIFVAFAQVCWGQLYFKSRLSGNWNAFGTSGTWLSCTTEGGIFDFATRSPGSSDFVTILNHQVTLSAAASAKNLTISSSGTISTKTQILTVENVTIDGKVNVNVTGTFNVLNNVSVTLNGLVDVYGKFIVTSNAAIDGNTIIQTGGTFFIGGNMTGIGAVDVSGRFNVIGNATLSGNSIVEGGGSFDVQGNVKLDATDCLILRSAYGVTGSFTFKSKDITSAGNIMVERWMSDTPNWHLYSSPLSGETIHNFLFANRQIPDLLSDPLNPNSVIGVGMRKYIPASDLWSKYLVYGIGLPEGDIEVGRGYSIRTIPDGSPDGYTQPGSIYAHGTLNPNDVTVALKSDGNHWNCIGNPFTSAIKLKPSTLGGTDGLLNPANLSKLDDGEFQAVYVWDTNNITTNNTTPEYIILNNATSINSLQISQGFFVKSNKNNTNSISDTLSFTKSMQSPNSSLSFKDAITEWPSLKIIATNQTLSSSTEIKFVSNTTKGLDPGYDAGMLKANPDFALYSKLLIDNPVDFGLQCLPAQNFDQYVIPIGIDSKAANDITFTAEVVNLPSGCQALLEDRLTKKFTKLDLKDAKYTATIDANTKGIGRFYLHTSDVISVDQPIEKEQFKINAIGKTVYINGEVSETANFFVYSVNGKLLANFKAASLVQNQFDASRFPAGVYILTVDDQNQKKSVKFVIEN